jgi:hypothetical protein
MKNYKVGMETAEAGPEVHRLKSGTGVKMIFMLIVLLLHVFDTLHKINVLYLSRHEVYHCIIVNVCITYVRLLRVSSCTFI